MFKRKPDKAERALTVYQTVKDIRQNGMINYLSHAGINCLERMLHDVVIMLEDYLHGK